MSNPVLQFVGRLVLSLSLFIVLIYFLGLKTVYESVTRSVNSVKWAWVSNQELKFEEYNTANPLNNDTVISMVGENGYYLMNTQKYSLRFYVLCISLIVAIPGSLQSKLKAVVIASFLLLLFISLKMFISIFHTAQINSWGMSLLLPEVLTKNLEHLHRFIVMSSHMNMLVVFAIWILVSYDNIRSTFLHQV